MSMCVALLLTLVVSFNVPTSGVPTPGVVSTWPEFQAALNDTSVAIITIVEDIIGESDAGAAVAARRCSPLQLNVAAMAQG